MSANVGDLTVKLGLEVDGSKGVEQLRSQIRALEREPDPKIGLDTRQADTNIQRLTQRIESLSRQSNEIRVGADTTGAERSVGRLDEILSRTTRAQYTAQVTADIDQALAELGTMQAQLSRLDDRPAHVQVRAETDQAVRDLQALRREMGMVEADTVNVSTQMAGMSSVLSGLGKQAVALGAGFGIAQAGMNLIGRAADFLRDAVWGANITLDQTTVRINAFTRDAGETARIMEQLRQKAIDTGRPFLDLGEAVATIGPLAAQTGQPLMELLDTAILLSAVNPAEGLSGAIFSLREALSGDWMSLMDRFNMPRSIINQMKADGVPALTIINELLRQQGVDMQMVGQMAGIADSRMRTLFGNLRMAAAQLGRPAFEAISNVIDQMASYTSSEAFQNDIKAVQDFAQAIRDLPPVKVVEIVVKWTVGEVPEGLDWLFTSDATPVGRLSNAGGNLAEASREQRERNEAQKEFVDLAHESASAYQQFVDAHAYDEAFIGNQQELNRQAEAYHFQQQQLEAQLARVRDAEEQVGIAQQQRNAANQQALRDSAAASQSQRDADEMLALNDATAWYVNTLSEQEQALFRIAEANNQLIMTQDRLSEAYQQGLQVQTEFTQQGAEYASQASNIQEALDIIQQKQADGIELTEQEIFIRDNATTALDRYRGGQEDAAMTAGEYAIRNSMVMQAQDELNAALGRGEISQEDYARKMQEAYAAAGLTYDATANNSTIMATMGSVIATQLVPAILDLVRRLDELNGKHVTTTVETRFITTGDPATGQMYGQSVSGTTVGLTERAAGGFIDRPQMAMIGEEAPAHPEYVIPTNPSRRGRALGLWMEAGRSLGVPGFADGGGPATAGSGGGTAPGAIDWAWLFAGLDTEAENYTERAAQAFVRMFDDIEALANGDALRDAQQQLDELFMLRQIAIDTGAGEAVVAGLDAQIAAQQAQVNAIGQVMGSEVIMGMAAEMASAESQQKINDALAKTIGSMTSASDPFQKVQSLGQNVRDLRDAIAVAEAMGNMEVADSLREELAAAQDEFLAAQNTLTTMLQLGLIDDETIQQMAERGGEAFRKVYDTVFGEGALAELQAGWQRLSDEQYAQLAQFVANGGELSDQLVTSIVDGLTSGVLDIQQAMQLLGDEQGKLAKDQQKQLYTQLQTAEQQLMQALASGDQSRIEAAQANYDALMQLIAAYAAATGRSVEDIVGAWARVDSVARNAVTGQIIRRPGGMGGMGGGSRQSIEQAAGQGGARSIVLYAPSGHLMGQWYANELAREVALAPGGIG